MNYKVDENLPAEVIEILATAGHVGETVHDEGLTGVGDPELMARVRQEQRVLLTLDKGIADIRRYPPRDYAGIIVFRPPKTGRGETLEFIRRELPAVLRHELDGRLFVVTDRGIRRR